MITWLLSILLSLKLTNKAVKSQVDVNIEKTIVNLKIKSEIGR